MERERDQQNTRGEKAKETKRKMKKKLKQKKKRKRRKIEWKNTSLPTDSSRNMHHVTLLYCSTLCPCDGNFVIILRLLRTKRKRKRNRPADDDVFLVRFRRRRQ